ncbi:unnamed protein product, partial [Sphacelaria rigidula]
SYFSTEHDTKELVVDVARKSASKLVQAAAGISRSRGYKAEVLSKHVSAKMVDVVSKKCGYEGCSRQPSYDLVESKNAEFCLKHAGPGMASVTSKKC